MMALTMVASESEQDLKVRSQGSTPTKFAPSRRASPSADPASFEFNESEYGQDAAIAFTLEHNLALSTYVVLFALLLLLLGLCGYSQGRYTAATQFTTIGTLWTTRPSEGAQLTR